ncbi:uncharacterized protein LOC127867340 isoform X2 [Dreissena polymorpha]|uniref:uncharacterized protein LOC127867340 isoform X2 n=1 Tax=Dreissena polymorpha TaxID=45954 RepID=UPI002264E9E3|nr:uncharacterized protein LOC127867340 isoform X2 [Dreissena polymorpha]
MPESQMTLLIKKKLTYSNHFTKAHHKIAITEGLTVMQGILTWTFFLTTVQIGNWYSVHGVSITINAGRNITCGEDVIVACHNDANGIVIQFAYDNYVDYKTIAECQFDVDPQLMDTRFKERFTVSQSCILRLRHFTERDCGTYMCAVMFNETQRVSEEVSCANGSTGHVPALETDKALERTEIKDCKIIIIIIVSALALALTCSVTFIVYKICKNTGVNSETGTPDESIPLEQQEPTTPCATPNRKPPDIRRTPSCNVRPGNTDKIKKAYADGSISNFENDSGETNC